MINDEILEKVIDDNDDARNICLILMLHNYDDDIEELCFFGITGKRAANLYYLTKGDPDLLHQSIKFIASEEISLTAIHKRLDSPKPRPLIERKIRPNETYSEFFEEQIEKCWTVNKKKR